MKKEKNNDSFPVARVENADGDGSDIVLVMVNQSSFISYYLDCRNQGYDIPINPEVEKLKWQNNWKWFCQIDRYLRFFHR